MGRDTAFFLGVVNTVTLMAISCLILNSCREAESDSVGDIKQEAVDRGYAKWVAENGKRDWPKFEWVESDESK